MKQVHIIFARYRIPYVFYNDNDPQFVNKNFQILQMNWKLTTE